VGYKNAVHMQSKLAYQINNNIPCKHDKKDNKPLDKREEKIL
jgi:hypothetical protein